LEFYSDWRTIAEEIYVEREPDAYDVSGFCSRKHLID
jgi:hypothetical protein